MISCIYFSSGKNVYITMIPGGKKAQKYQQWKDSLSTLWRERDWLKAHFDASGEEKHLKTTIPQLTAGSVFSSPVHCPKWPLLFFAFLYWYVCNSRQIDSLWELAHMRPKSRTFLLPFAFLLFCLRASSDPLLISTLDFSLFPVISCIAFFPL